MLQKTIFLSGNALMLKLKLQFFGHLMRRVDSLEKTLMLGGIGGRRRRVQLEPLRDRLHYLVEKRFRGELNKCDGCKLCK